MFFHIIFLVLFLVQVDAVGISENEYLGSRDISALLVVIGWQYLRRRRRVETRRSVNRRFWVCPSNSRRHMQGVWENLVQEFIDQEPEKFINYHRMSKEKFDDLLQLIKPGIQRQAVVREPIPAGLKLSLTLRYLASGDSMVSLAYSYRIGRSTTSLIIKETCLAIWDVLQPQVLNPPSREEWKIIADDFLKLWNFPNCVGAIDGKHVVVQCFNKTGSEFFNYKGTFSTSLMAIVDARYRFLFVSIGSKGRESDGGIFQHSHFGRAIAREQLPLPEPISVNGFPSPLPPVFLGDQAFPLLPQLMRPFPSTTHQQPMQRIFNYRHSRARRVVENAFGVMTNRFRIFRKPIIASEETVDAIVQAAIVLHNWLRNHEIETSENWYSPNAMFDTEDQDGTLREGIWRQEPAPSGLVSVMNTQARNPSVRAKGIRDMLATYFMAVGQVPWQWRHLPDFQRP